jgi:hypothetical protein
MNRIAGINKVFGIVCMSIFVLSLLVAVSIKSVTAVPTGPGTVTPISSSRLSTNAGGNVSAQAGNVSEFNFQATSITSTWQGYFGNVTGSIVLGNSQNNTFYNWNLASPQGEIYATRIATTPSWSTVLCANKTHVADEDTALGVNQVIDADSVNRTFLNSTIFSDFFVGSTQINGSADSGCYATRMYNSTGQQSENDWTEVLLQDSGNLIYTALLEQDAIGFDNRTHDFQMLVGENGHDGDQTVTPYYFYLELE